MDGTRIDAIVNGYCIYMEVSIQLKTSYRIEESLPVICLGEIIIHDHIVGLGVYSKRVYVTILDTCS